MITIIKKDGATEPFDRRKIWAAIRKSADRAMVELSDADCEIVSTAVLEQLNDGTSVTVATIHLLVEDALDTFYPPVAKSYKDYRNYKQDFVAMLDKVYEKAQSIRYIGDRDNANTDSALVSTQRSLIYNELNSELYKKFFLNVEEREAMRDGYIYIHDRSARLDTMNCCLFNVKEVLTGGFEMGNVWYNEPKTLDVAFDVISDIIMSAAAMQYGGLTAYRISDVLAPYAEKSYQKYLQEYKDIFAESDGIIGECGWYKPDWQGGDISTLLAEKADAYAERKVRRDLEQGFQSWEYRFNTVGSSRGDYPFIAVSFGNESTRWGQIASEVCLEVRRKGQGKNGFKKPVLFPKLTFLYDEELHGEGKPLEWLFDRAIECSRKCMYPDFLSLTGEGYIPSMYKKYGEVISLMG